MFKKITDFLITLWMWITFPVLTIFFTFPIAFCSIFLAPFDPHRKWAHFWGQTWGQAVIKVNPQWRLHVSGLKNIKPGQTYVIVSNHMSMVDILCLYYLNIQFKWIAKTSLFKIPFLGWSMSFMHYIRLERGHHGSIRKSYEEAKRWIQKGVSVVIFPEGTRSPSGTLNAFKNGAFKLAIETQAPILPVALYGNEKLIPKGKIVVGINVHSYLRILPAIDTKECRTEDFARVRDQVHTMIKAEIENISNDHL